MTKRDGRLVRGIPTMFLLDKKAILRDVDARDGTDAKIAELLAENCRWRRLPAAVPRWLNALP